MGDASTVPSSVTCWRTIVFTLVASIPVGAVETLVRARSQPNCVQSWPRVTLPGDVCCADTVKRGSPIRAAMAGAMAGANRRISPWRLIRAEFGRSRGVVRDLPYLIVQWCIQVQRHDSAGASGARRALAPVLAVLC